jgi:hypothetical protein
MTTTNRTTLQAHEQTALLGIDKYFGTAPSMLILGTTYTPPQAKKVLTDDLLAQAAAGARRADLRVAVGNAKETRAVAQNLLSGLKTLIVMTYGTKAANVLEDFGFPPAKQPKKAAKVKAVAVDKSLATRAARHTMGKKQKAKIKGVVTAPEAPPSPPAPAPAPAVSPGPAPKAANGQ